MTTTPETLPRRLRETLDSIVRLTEQNGCPPSLAELSWALRSSSIQQTAARVRLLQKRGLISREQFRGRSIRLVRPPEPPN